MRFSQPAAWFLSLVLLGFCPLLQAQSASPGGQTASPGGGTVTNPLQIALTGCLKRVIGPGGGGYIITDQNGTTWKLTPNGVNLAEHVNHSVMITGKPVSTTPPPDNAPAGSTVETNKTQPGLRVLTVKMLSPSCTR